MCVRVRVRVCVCVYVYSAINLVVSEIKIYELTSVNIIHEQLQYLCTRIYYIWVNKCETILNNI